MAGGWATPPIYASGQDLAANLTNSYGTLLTTGAANTKGSWTQLIASTANDIAQLLIGFDMYGAAGNAQIAFDLAAATSGNESSGIIFQNVVVQGTQPASHIMLPVGLKAGTRLAARASSATASDTPHLQIIGFDTGYTETISGSGLVDTYGYGGSGAITGISVDPGATADTKGSYTQITASTTNDLCGFFLGFDFENHIPTAGSDGHTLLDVAVGASGSEVIIVPNYPISKNNFSGGLGLSPALTPMIYCPIKSGTRIAVRAQSNSNTATDRLIGVSVYGLRS